MKTTKILKWLPMLAVFMVAIATTLISCTDDSSEPKDDDEQTLTKVDEQTAKWLDSIFSEKNSQIPSYTYNDKPDSILYIINSNEELNAINPFDFEPDIDFSKYTLLGWASLVSGRYPTVSTQLITNDALQNYKYEITLKYENVYTAFGTIYFWEIVPKLNPEYSLEFEIEHIAGGK